MNSECMLWSRLLNVNFNSQITIKSDDVYMNDCANKIIWKSSIFQGVPSNSSMSNLEPIKLSIFQAFKIFFVPCTPKKNVISPFWRPAHFHTPIIPCYPAGSSVLTMIKILLSPCLSSNERKWGVCLLILGMMMVSLVENWGCCWLNLRRDESNRPLNCGGRQVGKLKRPTAAYLVLGEDVTAPAYIVGTWSTAALYSPKQSGQKDGTEEIDAF